MLKAARAERVKIQNGHANAVFEKSQSRPRELPTHALAEDDGGTPASTRTPSPANTADAGARVLGRDGAGQLCACAYRTETPAWRVSGEILVSHHIFKQTNWPPGTSSCKSRAWRRPRRAWRCRATRGSRPRSGGPRARSGFPLPPRQGTSSSAPRRRP